jgi:hypothetical protein
LKCKQLIRFERRKRLIRLKDFEIKNRTSFSCNLDTSFSRYLHLNLYLIFLVKDVNFDVFVYICYRYLESVTYHKKSLAIKREVGYVTACKLKKVVKLDENLADLMQIQ